MKEIHVTTRIVIADRLFDGHRLFDGPERTAVVMVDGVIEAVGRSDELTQKYPGAEVDDYAGATVLPGLIDCHVHSTLPGDGTPPDDAAARDVTDRHATAAVNLAAHLAAGVTTVRDLGSHEDFLGFEPDPSASPRLLRVGPPITESKGHMHFFGGGSGSSADAVDRMNRSLALGAFGVKIVGSGGGTVGTVPHETTLTEDFVAAVVEAAHRRDRVVTTHALSGEGVRRAITAGSDGVEHLAFMEEDGSSVAAPPADILEMAREAGTAFGSTLGVNYRYIDLAERGVLDPYELEEQKLKTADYLRGAGQVHAAGVRIVTGSDAGWKLTAFGDFALEPELLVQAGFSEVDALNAATAAPADYLKLRDLGVLAPRARADLLVVTGDPTTTISDLRNVAAVYLDGVQVVGAR
ncbi:hypothetical protein EEB14_38100 [Rhodococcus sp. WS4]|nr:hypothetical protein EEB14_38100 [Rhodococcus sp. WS4]